MLAINCPSCPHLIVMKPNDDRPPPWCPRCGADLKPRPVPNLPDTARQLWNERPAPSTAVTANPAGAEALQVETSAPPVPVPEEPRTQPLRYAEPTRMPEPLPSAATAPIPAWAGIFALACGIIPLMTLGGAIPTALGFGGASGCVAVARNPQMDVGTRLAVCTAITVGCWAALFVILGSLMTFFWL